MTREMVHTKFVNRYVNGKNRGYNNNNPTSNMNSLVEMMYYRMITELTCNRFKWNNLPDTVDERYLELLLYRNALAVFYDDRELGLIVQPSAGGTGVNFYDNPVTFEIADNGNTGGERNRVKYKTLKKDDCVPIWANYLRIPEYDVVRVYVEKLAKIDRIIAIATQNLQYSKVVMTDEKQRLTYQNLLRQHDQGMPVIFGNKNAELDLSNIAAFDVGGSPEALNTLLVAKSKLWAECMTFLGINNANQEKKERLVESEVSANDDQIKSTKAVALNQRRDACKKINKMFGLNISVGFHTDEDESESDDDESSDDNEQEETDK